MPPMAEPDDPAQEKKQKLAAVTGGRLRFCLSGGAGLKREVKEFFHEHGNLIIEGYGLTETSPTSPQPPDAFRFDSVGKPLPSVELRSPKTARSWPRAPTSSAATTRTRPPPRRPSPRTAGSRPATSGAGPRTASSRSSIARRTSS
jgi:acyl-CoA synthetase (AMP-forming)/AMP-acid ligase II